MGESTGNSHWTPELLERLNDQEFQNLVAELFTRLGYQTKVVGTGGPDEGVDILAMKSFPVQERLAIQCKRQERPVTVEQIRQYSALYTLHNVNVVLIVTSSGFTAPALQEARRLRVQLWDGVELSKLLQQYMSDLLPQYAATLSPPLKEPTATKAQEPQEMEMLDQKTTNPLIQVIAYIAAFFVILTPLGWGLVWGLLFLFLFFLGLYLLVQSVVETSFSLLLGSAVSFLLSGIAYRQYHRLKKR